MIDMRKQDEERIAIELDQLGMSYKFEATCPCEDRYLGRKDSCKSVDNCPTVKVMK